MEELEELSVGLNKSNTLLLKEHNQYLQCEFLKEGMVRHTVLVHCPTLANALRQECRYGILEGTAFSNFKNNFSKFSLHIKARRLYQELSNQHVPHVVQEVPRMAIA